MTTGLRGWTLALALQASALPGLLPAQAAAWEVIAQDDGIVVSRQAVAGRAFPRLRAVGEVQGTPYEVLAILMDVPGYVNWLPDCIESRIVRQTGPWRSIVYTQTEVPWPAANRDAVVENEVTFIEPAVKLRVTFRAIAATDVPARPGIVRMPLANGFYLIESIAGGRSRVHYEVDADPAGPLPGWLIALQSTRNPLQTLVGLRRQLQETRGRYDAQIAAFPG